MAINFPSNPNTNDTYSYGDKSWIFNGVAWEINNNGNIGNIAVTGNITAGNILTDNYFYANGDPFVSSNYGDSDVGDYLTAYTGNIAAGNISVTGTIDGYATTGYVDSEVANLVASAPSTLDTLNELAAALNDDANFATTITNLIGNNSANITTLQGNITSIETDIANLEANVPANLQSNVSTLESNVTTIQGNILALDNQVANLNYYDDTNVTTFLSDLGSNAITTTGDITANAFIGDGSQLTGLPAGYTDSNVESVLSGNITVGNISVTGTIDGYATTTYVDTEVANLVASAPETLDTLNELASALGNDPNLSATLTSLIGNNSANITTLQGNIVTIESDITTLQGNIITLDNQVANLNYYDDTNVTTFLSDIGSNTITTTGNITADYFIGNGSQLTGIDAGSAVTVGNVTPTSPSNGDTWFNTDSGIQYVYIDDGDSSQWVETQADTVLNIGVSGNYGDSNVLSYLGNISGNLIPSANVTYNLGSSTNQWHSLYVGPGSLYVNNKKVIEDDSGRITVSTSVNQNLAIKTTGSGDIELFPEGTGVVNIQGNVQADSGVIISGTGGLRFGSNLNLDNNNINNLDDPVQAQDAATKAYVDTQITSAQGNYSNTNVASYLTTYTGNIAAGNISVTGTIDGYATTSYVDSEVANLVASAPSTLDTLNELATALGNDPNLSTTLTSLIGNNSANITTLQGNITNLELDITNLEANIPANLQSNVTTLEGNIVSIESDITNLQGNITSIESDIANLEANITANLESNVTTLESNVTTLQGNIIALDNQVANLNYYDDTNVTTFLSDIGSNSITTTGDITANSFIGDGSQLTGLPASYSDSNVASYLPTYTGNITAGNILTDNYFYANGEAFVSGGGGNSLTLANSAPSSPNNGDIWVDSDTGREYTYINDGDSLQWVELATSFIDINSYDDSNVLAYLGNISGNLIPSANVTYDLGSETKRWNTLYLAGNTINLGGAQIKADPGAGTIALIPQVKDGESATKAIVIGSSGISTVDTDANGTVSSADIESAAVSANTSVGNLTATGNITTNNITVTGKINGTIAQGTITLSQPGSITSPYTGVSRFYPTSNLVITNVFASLGTVSSNDFIFKINKNGSNIGLYTVNANSHRMSGVTSNISVSSTDYLTLDVTSGTGATDLRVDLKYTLD